VNGANGLQYWDTELGVRRVARVNDINGDGNNDILIGNILNSYVIYGHSLNSPFPEVIETTDLNGKTGFILEHDLTWPTTRTISSAGDINNDGKQDFMIGSSFGNEYAGHTYIIFGRNSTDSPFPWRFSLNKLQASEGTIVNGIYPMGDDSATGDMSGSSLGLVGDVNGDGISDIIIGARLAGNNFDGESYLLYGWNNSHFPGLLQSNRINLKDLM